MNQYFTKELIAINMEKRYIHVHTLKPYFNNPSKNNDPKSCKYRLKINNYLSDVYAINETFFEISMKVSDIC